MLKLFGLLVAVAAVGVTLVGTAGAGRPAHAGKPAPSGTIAIAAGYTAQLGQPLAFDYTVSNLPGNAQARIEVRCYQDVPFEYTDSNGVTFTHTDPLVYAEARPAGDVFDPLGGAASVWIWHGGGASCDGILYYWSNQGGQHQVILATVAFAAGG